MMGGYLVQHYLESVAAPADKVACTDGRETITYGELEDFSGRLASLLIRCGVRRQDRVAVCTQRSVYFLPAILGVLKADAVYVPFDPKSPTERWQKIVTDCAPTVLLCDGQTVAPLTAINPEIPRICLAPRDKLPPAIADNVATVEDLRASPKRACDYGNLAEDLAYILYTSGSTGTPKGVMISHRNIRNYIDWAVDYFEIGAQDRILGTAPFYFDMSTFDLWCPVKAGATLCLADNAQTLFPEKLFNFIEKQEITLWKGISSLLFYIGRAGVLAPGRIPKMSRILFGGDALPARTLIEWMKVFPDKQFYNVYGPTEATGISVCYPVTHPPQDPGERIPIGLPCKGMKALLLDEELIPVGDGEVGELCLAGPGIGRGYLNDAERTARAFFSLNTCGEATETWYHTGDLVFRRPDGNLEFVGRKDQQVKIMGYRIELGEIEQALRAIDGVRDAAVVTAQRDGVEELIAFIENHGGAEPSLILSRLRSRLPHYMVPRRLTSLADLPRCGRGKIDRAALRELATEVKHGPG